MSLIPEDYLKELLSRIDVVEIVSRYVRLRKGGANHFGRCPFHAEKTPSFTVSHAKQFYHCFGCQANGTAIGFLMEYEGIEFRDAVAQLAKEAGMPPPDDGDDEQRKEIVEVGRALEMAAEHYAKQLFSNEKARAYARSRGLTQNTAQRFGIGYAPGEWTALKAVFGKGYDAPDLLAAGLVIEGENGRRYDRFRDRLMFPIHGPSGRPLAFGGRILSEGGKGEPKYLNSPEIPGFEKGRELYGLYQARQSIKEKECVFVVEGYMDVVLLAQHGVENAVATLGTACTEFHIRKLLRMASSVHFCFDGDAAGRTAAWRALENALPLLEDEHFMSFIFLPEGMDPDDYVKAHGAEGFWKLRDEAMPLSQFMIEGIVAKVDMTKPEGRSKLLKEARPFLDKMEKAPALRVLLFKLIAERAGVTIQEAERGMERKFSVAKPATPVRRLNVASLTRRMIELLVAHPHEAHRINDEWLTPEDEDEKALAHLVMIANSLDGSEPAAWVWEIIAKSPYAAIYMEAQAAAEEMPMDADNWKSVFADGLKQMEVRWVEGRLKELSAKDRSGGLSREERMDFIGLTQHAHKLRRSMVATEGAAA